MNQLRITPAIAGLILAVAVVILGTVVWSVFGPKSAPEAASSDGFAAEARRFGVRIPAGTQPAQGAAQH